MRNLLLFYLTVNLCLVWNSASQYDIDDKCPVHTLTSDQFEHEVATNLTWIKLNSCEIKVLDEDSFRHMSNLKYLSIANNSIKDLVVGTFQDNLKLKIIYLCYNKISELKNGIFASLVSTTELFLRDNHLESVEANVFSDMQSLRILDLGRNLIDVLSEDVFRNNRQLEVLKLDNNYITHLHRNTFKNLNQLKKLNIQANRIVSIRKELFSSLVNLKELILNHNVIKKIDLGSFEHNKNLTKIALNDNRLSHLDENLFSGLKRLEYIFVGNNLITYVSLQAKNQILITDTTSVSVGGHVSFTCNITGQQEVQWLRGNHTICSRNNDSLSVSGHEYIIITDVKNDTVSSTMFIIDARIGDEGIYTCQAESLNDSDAKHFELKVIEQYALNFWLIVGFTTLGFLILLIIVRITSMLLLKRYKCYRECERNEVLRR